MARDGVTNYVVTPTGGRPAEAVVVGSISPISSDMSDDQLVKCIGKGDGKAWRVLIERHMARLVGFAWHILGDQSEAEDVAQEAFIRLMKKAPDWEPGGAQVRSWLYRVAMNLCIDIKRKHRPVQLDEDLQFPETGTRAGEADRRLAIKRSVRAALDKLPERQRAALILVHFHGFSNPETARMMESSIEAVESMLARGRRGLRESLKPLAADLLEV
jgi:RNA polymerase sigma-70 factor (ECF subfamily)